MENTADNEKFMGKKRAENTNNLLPIFYIKDLATNNDSVGDQVDKHSLIFLTNIRTSLTEENHSK